MNPDQLSSLKKRIESQSYRRWYILEKAEWKCSECGQEYTGRGTLVVISKDKNKVLCKRCAARYKTPPSNKRVDNDQIVDEVITHGNMSEIAKLHGISRERVRQILTYSLTIQIQSDLRNGEYNNPENKAIKELVKDEIRQITDKRIKMKVWNQLEKAKEHGIKPEMYSSRLKFAQQVGFSINVLQRYAPEIIHKIRENITVGHGGLRWSRHYLRCRGCGTTSSPHQCWGYCYSCYIQTDRFKEIQESSRLRNKDKWLPKQKQYLKDYYNKQRYGGNRDKVLKRDDYRCFVCSISIEESKGRFGEELRVIHLEDDEDNRMDNLITACRDCFLKYLPSKRKGGKSVGDIAGNV